MTAYPISKGAPLLDFDCLILFLNTRTFDRHSDRNKPQRHDTANINTTTSNTPPTLRDNRFEAQPYPSFPSRYSRRVHNILKIK